MQSATRPSLTNANPSNPKRRAFARLAIGGAAAIALSACGGGGSDSDSSQTLRSVFDKLTPGLTREQIVPMVDFAPSQNNDGGLYWSKGAESLKITFNVLQGDTIATATAALWRGSGGLVEQRSLTGT